MTELTPKQLTLAENLMYEGKLEEALKIVTNFEKKEKNVSNDKLSALILKGWIYVFKFQYNEAAKAGERAYKLSQNLNKLDESIDALILKSYFLMRADLDEAMEFVFEAEKLMDSNTRASPSVSSRQKAELLNVKALIFLFKGEHSKALKLALSSLTLQEESGLEKLPISRTLILIGFIYQISGDLDASQDSVLKGLRIVKELGDKEGIAAAFTLMGGIEYYKGNFDQALNNLKHGYSLYVRGYTKWKAVFYMGAICKDRGQIDQALEYYEEANEIAEETENDISLMGNTMVIGSIYQMKGDHEKALKHLSGSLKLSEKIKQGGAHLLSLFSLTLLHIDKNSRELAQEYVNRLEELADQTESKMFSQVYTLAKALLLKTSGLSRNRVKAETLLKEIIEKEILLITLYVFALVFLCDYLLEELYTSNDAKVLKEINPLIDRLLKLAERQNSYSWLAEAKLLQAKLALIELKMEKAQKLMTEAQGIADHHSLDLLAMTISSEHDTLLEKLETWEGLKDKNAPMSERLNLAYFDGVINRLQGKQVIDPPQLINEEPILLLIMDNSGATYFNHSFAANWDHSDLFSSFMSAFNTFSSEIFSKSIDRIRIGENTILINPVEPFLACYVIKGQSYPALQKLTRFSEAIRESSEIWQALNKSVKTSEMLELDKPTALKTVINEIFT